LNAWYELLPEVLHPHNDENWGMKKLYGVGAVCPGNCEQAGKQVAPVGSNVGVSAYCRATISSPTLQAKLSYMACVLVRVEVFGSIVPKGMPLQGVVL